LCADSADRGPVLVLVSPEQVQVTDCPVLDATRSVGTVEAIGVALDADDVWNVDDATVQRLVDRAGVAVAADAIGGASSALEATGDDGGMRQQFGRATGSFQAVKPRCADMGVSMRRGRERRGHAVEAVRGAASTAET